MDNMATKGYMIIVSDKNEKELCDALKARYMGNDWIDVIVSSEYCDSDESYVYIMVGDSTAIDENVKRAGRIIIDLSDLKILNMIDSDEELSVVRNLLIDGITLSKEAMVGIDYMDIHSVLQGNDNISVGMIHCKSVSDMSGLVQEMIAKARINISECGSAYLYVDGDIGLMEVNELANELDEVMGEEANIAFTAAYDSDKVDEFYAMVLFAI